ncbi:MAG: hypothetical protein ABFR31_00710 [Thermodesulfobacteriota bacterium]
MSFRIIVGIILISVSYTNIGCVASSKSISSDNSYILCEDPRPELCTMDYVPVCGKLIDGSLKTYSNGCSACSDKKVIGYKPHPCQ